MEIQKKKKALIYLNCHFCTVILCLNTSEVTVTHYCKWGWAGGQRGLPCVALIINCQMPLTSSCSQTWDNGSPAPLRSPSDVKPEDHRQQGPVGL